MSRLALLSLLRRLPPNFEAEDRESMKHSTIKPDALYSAILAGSC
jgi:hypothetical protein